MSILTTPHFETHFAPNLVPGAPLACCKVCAHRHTSELELCHDLMGPDQHEERTLAKTE